MVKVQEYIKNIGKSVVYATADVIKDYNPVIADTVDTNQELFKTMAYTIRDHKLILKKTHNYISTSKIYEAADQMKSSILEDITTGKLYNPERKAKVEQKAMGLDSWNDDMDISTGDEFNFDDNADDEFNIDAGDEYLADSFEMHSKANATMVSTTIARTSEYIVSNQRQLNEQNMLMNMKAFKDMTSHLSASNDNIGKLVEFNNKGMSTFIDNSKTYYETTTKTLGEINAYMKESVEMQRNQYKNSSGESTSSSKRITYDDLITASGSLNISEYFKNVGRNIKNETGMLGAMGNMFEDGNTLLAFAAAPLEFIPKMMVTKLIGENFKKSSKKLNESVSGFFSSALSFFNDLKMEDNFLSKIGNLFGVNNQLNTKVDPSKYEKGAVAWDGVAKKALTEVIPGLLSKLVALQSGKNEMVYDYDAGKFVDIKEVKKLHNEKIKSAADSGAGDVRREMTDMLEKFTFSSLDQQKRMQEDMDNFFKYFLTSGRRFDPRRDQSDYDLDISSDNYEKIKTMFKGTKRSSQMNFDRGMMESRSKLNKEFDQENAKGTSLFAYLENNFKGGEIVDDNGKIKKGAINTNANSFLDTKDTYGNNVFFYLNKITATLLEGIKVYNMGGDLVPNNQGIVDSNGNLISRGNPILTRDINLNNYKYERSSEQEKEDSEKRNFEYNKKRKKEKGNIIEELDNMSPEDFGYILSNKLDTETRLEKAKRETDKKNNRSFGGKFLESMVGTSLMEKFDNVTKTMTDITSKPWDFMANMMDNVDLRLYEILYGKEQDKLYKGEKVRGFMDMLKVDLQDTFTNLNEWLEESIFKPMQDNIFPKLEEFGDNLLRFTGSDKTVKDFQRDIGKFFTGDKDEDGNYVSTSIFSDILHQTKSDMFDLKSDIIGAPGAIAKITKLAEQYMYDRTKRNEIDQSIVLDNMLQALVKFHPRSPKEIALAKSIQSIINDVDPSDPHKTITAVLQEIVRSGYAKSDTLMALVKEKTATAMVYSFGNRDAFVKIQQKLLSSKLDENQELVQDKGIDKDKFTYISGTIYKHLNGISNAPVSLNKKLTLISELMKELNDIEADTKDEANLKASLFACFANVKDAGSVNKALYKFISILSKNIHQASATLLSPIASALQSKNEPVAIGSDLNNNISAVNPLMSTPIDRLLGLTTGLQSDANATTNDIVNASLPKVEGASVFNNGNTPFENLINDIKKLPEHADGASYIPRDNYVASLHKGEGVITADVNKMIPAMFEKISSMAESMSSKIKDVKKLSKDEYNERLLEQIRQEVDKYKPKTERDGEDKEKILNIIRDYSDTQKALNDISDLSGGNISDNNKDTPSLATRVGEEMHSMVNSIKRSLFGTDKEKDIDKKVNEDLENVVQDVKSNFKDYLPSMGSGAIIGGGIGAIAGLVGGPLAWAGIGAGAAFIKKSESAQKFLFGEKDEKGSRKGGLVGKGLIEAFEKYAPGMKKSGITGAALGLLPFTPFGVVGGLMGGVIYNFAKKNETVQDMLFGEDHGILGPKAKKFLDGLAPRGIAGAIGGGLVLGGPFGLVGGAMIGAAVGMATKSQKFTEMLIGKEDKDGKLQGGLIGFMREKVLDLKFFVTENMLKPVVNSIKPLAKEVGHIGKLIVTTVADKVGKVFETVFGEKFGESMDKFIFTPFKKVIGGAGSFITKGLGDLITSPFRMIDHFQNQLRYNQMVRDEISGKKSYSDKEKASVFEYMEENNQGGYMGAILKGYKSRRKQPVEQAPVKEVAKAPEESIEENTKTANSLTEKTHSILEKILYAIKGEPHPGDKVTETAKAVTDNIPNDLEAQSPEQASMLTPHGELKFKRDYKGTLKPLNNEVHKKLSAEENRDNKFQDDLLEIFADQKPDKPEEEKKSLFSKIGEMASSLLGFGGGMLKIIPALMVALPLLPAIVNGISGILDFFNKNNPDPNNETDIEGNSILEGGYEALTKTDSKRSIFNFIANSSNGAAKISRAVLNPTLSKLNNKLMNGINKVAVPVLNSKAGKAALAYSDDLATKGFTIFKKAFEIFKNPKIVKIIGESAAASLSKIPEKLAEKTGKNILGQAGKKLAGWLGPIGVAITVGDIVWGMDNADEILQVEGDMPLGVRIISGIVNALNQRFLFGLVPKKYLLASVIEVMPKDLQEDISEGQAALKATYANYKESAGSTAVSFDEYSKKSSKYNKQQNVTPTSGSKFKRYNPFTWGKGNSEPQFGMGSGPQYGTGILSKLFGGKTAEEKQAAKDARYGGVKAIRPTGKAAQRTSIETAGKLSPKTKPNQNSAASRAIAGGRTKQELMNQIDPPAIPFFSQKDRRWANERFNGKSDTIKQTIGDSGCGPTAASMVVSAFKGSEVYPNVAANFAVKNGFKEKNGGTKPGFFSAFAGEHGVSSTSQKLDGKTTPTSLGGSIIEKIKSGIPTILMGKGGSGTPFGKRPHYVVATGVDTDGKVFVHDPEKNKGNGKFNLINTIKSSSYAITSNAYQSAGIPSNESSDTSSETGEEVVTDDQIAESQGTILDQILKAGEILVKGLMGIDYSDLLGTGGGDDTGYAGGVGGTFNISSSKKDFIKRLVKVAMEGYRSKKILPSVHIAQAIHESAWGASGLAQKGKNLFGFKCGSSWTGDSINMKTGEVYNGKSTVISANFRKYKTWEDSQRDYNKQMSTLPRYKGFAGASNYKTAINILVKGGYATDPAYVSKVVNTIEKYNLHLLDKGSDKEFLASLENGAVGGSAMADGTVKPVLSAMESVKGKLSYSMTGPRNPEKGSADCSSVVRWAYSKGAKINVGHSTLDQIQKGSTVDKGKVAGGKSNLSNLKPGDLLFFQRPHGKTRPYGVGHVEMYYGNGKMIGHGGGAGGKVKGPTVKSFNPNDPKYILAKRHIRPTDTGNSSKTQAVMGLGKGPAGLEIADRDFAKRVEAYTKHGIYDKNIRSADDMFARQVQANTELGDYGNVSPSVVKSTITKANTLNDKFKNTDIYQKLRGRLTPVSSNATTTTSQVSPATVANKDDSVIAQSLQILITLITKMLEHTGNLSQVVELLSKGLNINIPEEDLKSLTKTTNSSSNITKAIRKATSGQSGSISSSSMAKLIANMNEIIAQP